MINKKFEMLKNKSIDFCGKKLYRIKALISFGLVFKGDIGGYIEREQNLSENGNAWVYGDALVSGNAKVSGDAQVYGDARVYGDATVLEYNRILTGYLQNKSSLLYQLASQIGILPNKKGIIILYKRVNKTDKNKVFSSCWDITFKYILGKSAKVKNYDKSTASCGRGLHLSTPLYWNEGDTLLECEVNIKDIITVQEGKVRCKACKPIRVIKF